MSECVDTQSETIRAEIARVVSAEETAWPYLVAFSVRNVGELSTRESVTVSLKGWRGEQPPQAGMMIELEGTVLWRNGWRAQSAQPVTPCSTAR